MAAVPYVFGVSGSHWPSKYPSVTLLRMALAEANSDGNVRAVEEILAEMQKRGFMLGDYAMLTVSREIEKSSASDSPASIQLLKALFAICGQITSEDLTVQEALLRACTEGRPETVEYIVKRFFSGHSVLDLMEYFYFTRSGCADTTEKKLKALMCLTPADDVKTTLGIVGLRFSPDDGRDLTRRSSLAEMYLKLEMLRLSADKICSCILANVDVDAAKSFYSHYKINFRLVHAHSVVGLAFKQGNYQTAEFLLVQAKTEIELACEQGVDSWLNEKFGPGNAEYYFLQWAAPYILIRDLVRSAPKCFLGSAKVILKYFALNPPVTIASLLKDPLASVP